MSHLSVETIARLVDEQPSALDNAHLDACAPCRAELDAMRADVAALAGLGDIAPPAAAWSQIESRLEAEGLLTSRLHIAPARSRSFVVLSRAAAIALFFLGGTVVGRSMKSDAPQVAQVAQVAQSPSPSPSPSPNPDARTDAGVHAPAATPSQSTPVRLAASGDTRSQQSAAAPRSTQRNTSTTATDSGDPALRALRDAEDKYFSALSKYSEKAGTVTNDPTARLAALEGIVLTTRAALAQAPTDPVINGYHLTALAQRDAMLKQIRATPATSW